MENTKEIDVLELGQIIPKEKTKINLCDETTALIDRQETQGYICPQTKKQCDDECCVSAEDCHIEAGFGIIYDCELSKQETLEEVAKNYINNDLELYEALIDGYISYDIGINLLNTLFIKGAKWQAEKMYNKEEIMQIFKDWNKFNDSQDSFNGKDDLNFNKWFENYKK